MTAHSLGPALNLAPDAAPCIIVFTHGVATAPQMMDTEAKTAEVFRTIFGTMPTVNATGEITLPPHLAALADEVYAARQAELGASNTDLSHQGTEPPRNTEQAQTALTMGPSTLPSTLVNNTSTTLPSTLVNYWTPPLCRSRRAGYQQPCLQQPWPTRLRNHLTRRQQQC